MLLLFHIFKLPKTIVTVLVTTTLIGLHLKCESVLLLTVLLHLQFILM